MAHATHHVVHTQPFNRVECRHRGLHPLANSQCGPRISGAIHGLRKDRVGVIAGLNDDINGLARSEAELINGHGFDIHSVNMNNRELQARDAHVIEGVSGTIDHA